MLSTLADDILLRVLTGLSQHDPAGLLSIASAAHHLHKLCPKEMRDAAVQAVAQLLNLLHAISPFDEHHNPRFKDGGSSDEEESGDDAGQGYAVLEGPCYCGALELVSTCRCERWRLRALGASVPALLNQTTMKLTGAKGRLARRRGAGWTCPRLVCVPQVLCAHSKLLELDLSSNGLSDLPDSFSRLVTLKQLNLADNCFGALPVPVTALRSLTALDLSSAFSAAREAEDEDLLEKSMMQAAMLARLSKMVSLRVLKLCGLRLQDSPHLMLSKMRDLEHLDLSGSFSTGHYGGELTTIGPSEVLAEFVTKVDLRNLKELVIEDAAVVTFAPLAHAIAASSCLPRLVSLRMDWNDTGRMPNGTKPGGSWFAERYAPELSTPEALEKAIFDGMRALASALLNGALPSLTELRLDADQWYYPQEGKDILLSACAVRKVDTGSAWNSLGAPDRRIDYDSDI